MKTRKQNGVWVWGAIAVLAGCGNNPVEDVRQRFEQPALMHTWENDCKGLSWTVFPQKTAVKYSGDQFKEVTYLYALTDRSCSGSPIAEVEYSGLFDFPKDTDSKDRVTPINYDYKSAVIIAHTQGVSEFLEAFNACRGKQDAKKEWPIGQRVEVTKNSSSDKCPVQPAPSSRFDSFRIDGDRLFVGKAGAGSRAASEAERPNEADESRPYHKVDRSL